MLIGVDLGGTNVRAGLVRGESLVTVESMPLERKDDRQHTLHQFLEVVRAVFDPEVEGIGVGVPSVVDVDKGIVYDAVNIPSWKEVPLRSILEKEFGVPAHINNDVNCFVLGEKHFGQGKPYANLMGIAIGTGIGSGLILGNRLYLGANCGAGEIGYLPYLDRDLEYYCSSAFFERAGTTARDAFFEAEKGSQSALGLWATFGHHLGMAMKAALYAYDPEMIILGGSISRAYRYFEASMRRCMQDTYFPRSVEKLQIRVSGLEHSALLGAAALALQGRHG